MTSAGRSTGKAMRKPVPKNEIRIGDGADFADEKKIQKKKNKK